MKRFAPGLRELGRDRRAQIDTVDLGADASRERMFGERDSSYPRITATMARRMWEYEGRTVPRLRARP